MPDPAPPRPEDAHPLDPASLYATLDFLPQHQALMSAAGAVVRLNRLLVELLRRLPQGRYLEEALGVYARAIAADGCCAGAPGPGEVPAMEHFHTPAGSFRMWGWCVDLDRYGLGCVVLMTVQPLADLPLDESLRKRLKLTPKEVDVVRLLDEGRSNRGIATALCISPHTARHHTENVMAKVGASSRAEVGPRIRAMHRDRRR